MRKILVVFALININVCSAQTFSCVKVYISNAYVERVYSAKPQNFNMDYVRSHYATYVFSMEKNYINNFNDSLLSRPLTRVAYDSVEIIMPSGWGCGTLEMNFEPCIVIDFIVEKGFNTNEEVWTFAVNRQGYVCRTFPAEGNLLCYPEMWCLDFLKRCFPGMLFFRE